MPRAGTIRSACRLGLLLALAGGAGMAALAQSTSRATCTVRIRPQAAADYDLSAEVTLQGVVEGREGGTIRLRLPAGRLRVDTGASGVAEGLDIGTQVEIVASRRVIEGRQHFLAREIRHDGGVLVLRDALGVPVAGPTDQL